MAAKARADSSRGASPKEAAHAQRPVLKLDRKANKQRGRVVALSGKLDDYVEVLPPQIGETMAQMTGAVVGQASEQLKTLASVPVTGADASVQDDRHRLDNWLRQWEPWGSTSLIQTDGTREVKLAGGQTIRVEHRTDPYEPDLRDSRKRIHSGILYYHNDPLRGRRIARVVVFGAPHTYENHAFVPCGNVVWVGETQAESKDAWRKAKERHLASTQRSQERRERENRVLDTGKLNAHMGTKLERAPSVEEMIRHPERTDWNINSIMPTGEDRRQYGQDIVRHSRLRQEWERVQSTLAKWTRADPLSTEEMDLLVTKGYAEGPAPAVTVEQEGEHSPVVEDDLPFEVEPAVPEAMAKGYVSMVREIPKPESVHIPRLPAVEHQPAKDLSREQPQAQPAPAEAGVNRGKSKRQRRAAAKQREIEMRRLRKEAQLKKLGVDLTPIVPPDEISANEDELDDEDASTVEVAEESPVEEVEITPPVTPERKTDIGAEAAVFVWAADEEYLFKDGASVKFEVLDKDLSMVAYSNVLRAVSPERLKAGLQVMQGLKPLPDEGKPEALPATPVVFPVPLPVAEPPVENLSEDELLAREINDEQEWLHDLRRLQTDSERRLFNKRMKRLEVLARCGNTAEDRVTAAIALTQLEPGVSPKPWERMLPAPVSEDSRVIREPMAQKMRRIAQIVRSEYKRSHLRDVRITSVMVGSVRTGKTILSDRSRRHHVPSYFCDVKPARPQLVLEYQTWKAGKNESFVERYNPENFVKRDGITYQVPLKLALLERRKLARLREYGTLDMNEAFIKRRQRERLRDAKAALGGPPSRFVRWAWSVGDETHTPVTTKSKTIQVWRGNALHRVFDDTNLRAHQFTVLVTKKQPKPQPRTLVDAIFQYLKRGRVVEGSVMSGAVEKKDVLFKQNFLARKNKHVYLPGRQMRIHLRNNDAVAMRKEDRWAMEEPELYPKEVLTAEGMRLQSWLNERSITSGSTRLCSPRVRPARPTNIQIITEERKVSGATLVKDFVSFTNELKLAGVEVSEKDTKLILQHLTNTKEEKAASPSTDHVVIDGVKYVRA